MMTSTSTGNSKSTNSGNRGGGGGGNSTRTSRLLLSEIENIGTSQRPVCVVVASTSTSSSRKEIDTDVDDKDDDCNNKIEIMVRSTSGRDTSPRPRTRTGTSIRTPTANTRTLQQQQKQQQQLVQEENDEEEEHQHQQQHRNTSTTSPTNTNSKQRRSNWLGLYGSRRQTSKGNDSGIGNDNNNNNQRQHQRSVSNVKNNMLASASSRMANQNFNPNQYTYSNIQHFAAISSNVMTEFDKYDNDVVFNNNHHSNTAPATATAPNSKYNSHSTILPATFYVTNDRYRDINDGASSACSSLTDYSAHSSDITSTWRSTHTHSSLPQLQPHQHQQQQPTQIFNIGVKNPIAKFRMSNQTQYNNSTTTKNDKEEFLIPSTTEFSSSPETELDVEVELELDHQLYSASGAVNNRHRNDMPVVTSRSRSRSGSNHRRRTLKSSVHRPSTATPPPDLTNFLTGRNRIVDIPLDTQRQQEQQHQSEATTRNHLELNSSSISIQKLLNQSIADSTSINSTETPNSQIELVAQVKSLDSLLEREVLFSSPEATGRRIHASKINNDEDDGLTRELEELVRSEHLLRRELENCNDTQQSDIARYRLGKSYFSDSDDDIDINLRLFPTNYADYNEHRLPSTIGSVPADDDDSDKDAYFTTVYSTYRFNDTFTGNKDTITASNRSKYSNISRSASKTTIRPLSLAPFSTYSSSDDTDSNDIHESGSQSDAESITPVPTNSFESTTSSQMVMLDTHTPLGASPYSTTVIDTVTPLVSNRSKTKFYNGAVASIDYNEGLCDENNNSSMDLDVPGLFCTNLNRGNIAFTFTEANETSTYTNTELQLISPKNDDTTIDFTVSDASIETKLTVRRPEPSSSPVEQPKEALREVQVAVMPTPFPKRAVMMPDDGDVKLFSMKPLKDNGTMTDAGDAKPQSPIRTSPQRLLQRESMRSLPSLFLPTPLRRTYSDPSSNKHLELPEVSPSRSIGDESESSDGGGNNYFNLPREMYQDETLGHIYSETNFTTGTSGRPRLSTPNRGPLQKGSLTEPPKRYGFIEGLHAVNMLQQFARSSFHETDSDRSDNDTELATRLGFGSADDDYRGRSESIGDLHPLSPIRVTSSEDEAKYMSDETVFRQIHVSSSDDTGVTPSPSSAKTVMMGTNVTPRVAAPEKEKSDPIANMQLPTVQPDDVREAGMIFNLYLPSQDAIVPESEVISHCFDESIDDESSTRDSIGRSIHDGHTATVSQLSVDSSVAEVHNETTRTQQADTPSLTLLGKCQIFTRLISMGWKWVFIGACFLIVVVVVSVVASVVRPMGSDDKTNSLSASPSPSLIRTIKSSNPTPTPSVNQFWTSSPTNNKKDVFWGDPLFVFLVKISPKNGSILRKFNYKSPQFQAYDWLSRNRFLSIYSDVQIAQRYALATFYYSTRGDNWVNSTNWLSNEDECTWFTRSNSNGMCGTSNITNQTILLLDLHSNDLHGRIPSELALLSNSLQSINFAGGLKKFIYGTLPTELGFLTRMTSLSLDNNKLTGTLPSEILSLTSLTYLNVSNNQFSGTIPNLDTANMASLKALDLSDNNFSGNLPSFGRDNDQLQWFSLQNNARLHGTIPESWQHLTSIRAVDLRGTNVSNSIPT